MENVDINIIIAKIILIANHLFFDCFQPHPTSEDIVIVQENEYCQSEKMPIFIGAIYAYKGLLLVRLFFAEYVTYDIYKKWKRSMKQEKR